MAEPLYGLTGADLDVIKALVRDYRNGPTRGRGYDGRVDHEEQQAPEVYVALTPSGGIPALAASSVVDTGTGQADEHNGDAPGYAECAAYRVLPPADGTDGAELWEVPGLSFRVHNASGSDVAGDSWVLVVRDKGGVWWAVTGGGGGSEASFLVLLTEVQWVGAFRQYSAVEVEALGELLYAIPEGGRTFGPAGTPLYHERNQPYPVVGVYEGSGTGEAGEPRFIHHWSVVRVRQGPDGYWYFGEHPYHDIVRRTGDSDADGEVAYVRYNAASVGVDWQDGDEVRLIEAE